MTNGHGYYNLQGKFISTSTKAAATAAWREERGYKPIGVFDVGGGEVVDTRQVARERAPTTPIVTTPTEQAAANLAQTFTGYDVQGIQSLAPTLDRSAEVTARAGVSTVTAPTVAPSYDVQGIQSTPPSIATHLDVPYEQFAANVDVPRAWAAPTSAILAPDIEERQYDLSSRFGTPETTQQSPWQRSLDFNDYNTRQYELEQFGTPPQPQAEAGWTQSEIDMLGGMSVDAAIAWGARYTGQALFGDVDPRTGEFFQGAFDRETGEIVNPNLMPSLLSPAFANQLGISEQQRVMLGYNPDYPYQLLDITGGPTRVAGPVSGGGYGIADRARQGYGYAPSNPLISWRIGYS